MRAAHSRTLQTRRDTEQSHFITNCTRHRRGREKVQRTPNNKVQIKYPTFRTEFESEGFWYLLRRTGRNSARAEFRGAHGHCRSSVEKTTSRLLLSGPLALCGVCVLLDAGLLVVPSALPGPQDTPLDRRRIGRPRARCCTRVALEHSTARPRGSCRGLWHRRRSERGRRRRLASCQSSGTARGWPRWKR